MAKTLKKEDEIRIPGVNFFPDQESATSDPTIETKTLVQEPEPIIEETVVPEFTTEEKTPIIGKPTSQSAVFDGDNPGVSGNKGGIFDGQDLGSVTKEISGGTELGNSFAKEIQRRRSIEGTTGTQDPILSQVGFSTIADAKDEETANLVSLEGAQKIASDILTPGNEFEKLGLSQTGVYDDRRVRSFFESQGYDKNQIDSIIQARDAKLKENRIRDDGENAVEQETARVTAEIDREKERIQESVNKNMNIAQRQRSLRGVGLSSATEGDLRSIQEKGDELIDAYAQQKNTELRLFEAQQNNADSETIYAIQQQLQSSINAKNQLIKDNADIQSKLVAQGKLDSTAAFDSLMGSLNMTDADKEGVSEEVSELVGFLSDKYGNAIMIDGEKFPVGGTTGSQADEISAFADGILSGDLSGAGGVPIELRGKVLAALAKKRESMGSLSFGDKAQAAALAKQHFGNTKDENVAAIEGMLLEGKTASEISQVLENAGFSEAYTGNMRNIFGNIAGGLTKDARGFALSEFNRRLEEGNEKAAIQTLLSVAKETESTATQAQIQGRSDLLNNIDSLSKSLDEYTKAGGDTGKIPGTYEKILQLAGSTGDAKMATILNEIALSVQAYRKSQTGAAFSESESKEYQQIFPSVSNSLGLNATKIASLQNLFVRNTENFYRQKFGAAEYDEAFPDGVMGMLLPGTSYDKQKDFDYSSINSEMSDEDIVKALQQGGFGSTAPGGSTDFNIDDDDSVADFLNMDFNTGDQTSSSKGTLSKTNVGVSQDFGALSPLAIDNVRLVGGGFGTPGKDLKYPVGTPLTANISGKVIKVVQGKENISVDDINAGRAKASYGNQVIIQDSNGNKHYYNHLDGVDVKEGQKIFAGTLFGTSGNSGSSTGPHLDYRVKSSKGWENPNSFLIG